MDEFEIVKHIMMLDHISYDDLSKRMGYKSKANSYQRLTGKHIYVDTWRKFLEELGYEITVRRKDGTGQEYVIRDDSVSSPLRFHDMSPNTESIFRKKSQKREKVPGLTIGERNARSEDLKKRVSLITKDECDAALREIWGIKDPVPNKRKPLNEYMSEYERYRDELFALYSTNPVSERAHGEVITEDVVKDMSWQAMEDRRKERDRARRSVLIRLTSDFHMDE